MFQLDFLLFYRNFAIVIYSHYANLQSIRNSSLVKVRK